MNLEDVLNEAIHNGQFIPSGLEGKQIRIKGGNFEQTVTIRRVQVETVLEKKKGIESFTLRGLRFFLDCATVRINKRRWTENRKIHSLNYNPRIGECLGLCWDCRPHKSPTTNITVELVP